MILEVADIRIHPGQEAEFEKAVQLGLSTVFPKAKGFHGYEVRHSIESPERYILLLSWDTLEDHTVAFRESPLYTEWRGHVSPFFARPPFVEHFTLVASAGNPKQLFKRAAHLFLAALARVWKGQRFSWWMTSLLHRFPDSSSYDKRLQDTGLNYLLSSPKALAALAENYVGLPFQPAGRSIEREARREQQWSPLSSRFVQ